MGVEMKGRIVRDGWWEGDSLQDLHVVYEDGEQVIYKDAHLVGESGLLYENDIVSVEKRKIV